MNKYICVHNYIFIHTSAHIAYLHSMIAYLHIREILARAWGCLFKISFIIMKMGVTQNRPETPWKYPIWAPKCDPLPKVPIVPKSAIFAW